MLHSDSRRRRSGEAIRDYIRCEVIEPIAVDTLEHSIKARSRWKTVSDVTEGVAHGLLGVTSILAWISGVYETKATLFATGCCSTVSVVMLRYAAYASQQCEDYHHTLLEAMKYFDMKKKLPALEHPDSVVDTTPTPTPV